MHDISHFFSEKIGGKNFLKKQDGYKFQCIKDAKALVAKKHPEVEILDFSIGEPDGLPHDIALQTLCREAGLRENRGYADNGIDAFKHSAASYMQRVFDVELDWEKEINHAIGVKSALMLLPIAFVNPGDTVLMTEPGYSVFASHARWHGANVVFLPLSKNNHFFPNFDAIPCEVARKSKILVLNYPNNPTGALADKEFYERVARFVCKNDVFLIQDATYGELTRQPLSILSIPNLKERALELHSLSKNHNMTGWRIGFVCGAKDAVQAFAHVKNFSDSGQFIPIQKAAASVLDASPNITAPLKVKYERRLKLLQNVLNEVGFFSARFSGGTFFLYVSLLDLVDFKKRFREGALGFARDFLLEEAVTVVPWDEVDPHIRFSVTFCADSEWDEHRVMQELHGRLLRFLKVH